MLKLNDHEICSGLKIQNVGILTFITTTNDIVCYSEHEIAPKTCFFFYIYEDKRFSASMS